jgi:hypothetical protein
MQTALRPMTRSSTPGGISWWSTSSSSQHVATLYLSTISAGELLLRLGTYVTGSIAGETVSAFIPPCGERKSAT